jgi:hypothetical protein
MHSQVTLQVPFEVTVDAVERALLEQSKDEPAVARVFDQLNGAVAARAAEELNRALEIDLLDVLAQGWARVPDVHRAIQLSALTRGPPTLVNIDRHNINSISHLVLDTLVAGSALPPLELTLEISAHIRSADLAAHDGRIDLLALGPASIVARLTYRDVLLKEHATGISGEPRDPFRPLPPAADRPASIDFPI